MAAPGDEGPIVQYSALGRALRYRAIRAVTPDGVRIAVQDWAVDSLPRTASVILLHGFGQAHGAWLHQVSSSLSHEFRLVTYDMRGHGDSDKPTGPAWYRSPAAWADELQAVIMTAGVQRPVLVAWSYSGRIALDYLSVFGDAGLSGLVMVNAASNGAPTMLGPAVGSLRKMTSQDPAMAEQGTLELLHACVANSLAPDELAYMLAYNRRVSVDTRANLAGRPAEYDATLRALQIPTLVIQGSADPVTAPAMSAYTATSVPNAQSLTYDGIGHMPFWESPQRFNADLRQFVNQCARQAGQTTLD